MSFSRGLKEKAIEVWEEGYQHPFVQEIGKGTLAEDKFQFYLLQDYQYLLQYAKVFALAVVKAYDEATMTRLTNTQHYLLAVEMDVHRQYMAGFGVSQEQMLLTKPSLYNRTYTANMLAVGQTGDLIEILAAVFPCAWTYSDYAKRLKAQYADRLEKNFYRTWIETYAGDAFSESFEWFFDAMDEMVANMTDAQRERIVEIFVSSVEFEYLFWDMAYKQEMSYRL
ncbi:MAG: thiaminase II [Christensenellales bacterium]|jgi:thiaminase/transcriptional activator TenA